MINNKPREHSLFLKAFRAYLQYVNSGLYFRKEHVLGLENVPVNGTPVIVVANHQNCLNDPLCVCLQLTDRRMNFLARANVFNNPIFNKALRAMGLLPAYRMSYEGLSAVNKNQQTIDDAGNALMDGETVMLYPEAGHQDKRWLGTFSFGYTKMAFEAAELGNFEKEVFILPACNHYSHYFGVRNRMLVKFGTPISIQPYYELYKTKPRTAQREVNKLVREQISGLMLDIRDLDNYEAIDFIRTTYGVDYAKKQGVDPDDLPQRLLTDKQLVDKLEEAKSSDEMGINQLYREAMELKCGVGKLGITDAHLQHSVNLMTLGLKLLALLILFPLWVFSWWPSMLVYWIPMSIFKTKMKDPMFEGTLLFGSAALFTLPLFSLITLLVVGLNSGWLSALIYVALFPLLMLFCWKYATIGKKTLQTLKCLLKPVSVENLKQMRRNLHKKLNEIIN